MKKVIVTLSLSLLCAASAQNAKALFDEGKWQEATTAALALNTSEGYAQAAEYTTAGASLVADTQKKALFNKAQEYAKKAISLNANNAEGYFELARAQGRLAQFAGILQSLGLAGEMKKNLDTAVKLNPNLAGAYVALGLWNANLDAKGFAARAATGASKAQVVPNLEKAAALEPNVITHRLEYANALLLGGNKAGAKAQLEKAVTMSAENFWAKRDLAQAQALLAKLK